MPGKCPTAYFYHEPVLPDTSNDNTACCDDHALRCCTMHCCYLAVLTLQLQKYYASVLVLQMPEVEARHCNGLHLTQLWQPY